MKKTIIYILIITIVGAVTYSVLEQNNKQKVPGKLDRLACHKNITSFERVYDTSALEKAKKQLLSGNYKIKSDTDRSTYMQSTLFDYVDMKETDSYLKSLIEKKTGKKNLYKDGVSIEYTIFENDIEDPKKKSDKCKLYRGYVVMKVKNSNNKLLYQVQIDFMDYKGGDIPKTLECSLESFLTF